MLASHARLLSRRVWPRLASPARWLHCTVETESDLSLEAFRASYFERKPVVLKQEFAKLAAISLWPEQNFEYLRKYGDKLVTVELSKVNSTYATATSDSDFQQVEIPLGLFLDTINRKDASQDIKIYLAQHALFDTIPELYQDVCLPSFEQTRGTFKLVPKFATAGKADLYNINIWIGQSTHTPLHHDPYHNIFAQLFSEKQVILFPPEARDGLSFHKEHLKINTSSIQDIFDESTLAKLSPQVRESSLRATLSPGDSLYIPQGWLHSFKGSSGVSGSVNWWFR